MDEVRKPLEPKALGSSGLRIALRGHSITSAWPFYTMKGKASITRGLQLKVIGLATILGPGGQILARLWQDVRGGEKPLEATCVEPRREGPSIVHLLVDRPNVLAEANMCCWCTWHEKKAPVLRKRARKVVLKTLDHEKHSMVSVGS